MALIKTITTDSGEIIEDAYLKVTSMDYSGADFTRVTINVYRSQEARENGEAPVTYLYEDIPFAEIILYPSNDPEFEKEGYVFDNGNKPAENVNIVAQAYEAIKEKEEFLEAEDI